MGGYTLHFKQEDTMNMLSLMVTLWPSFPHFNRFADDTRLSGIRLNSAMITNDELEAELSRLSTHKTTNPLYFDIKGRQLRIHEVHSNPDYLDITLNHPIDVKTPTGVLFKAGEDEAILDRIEENGCRLIFRGGPRYGVRAGESLHIRNPSLAVSGPQFSNEEKQKIEQVKRAGFEHYFLSYVESQRDVDEFRELVGKQAEIMLKIETQNGLRYVLHKFRKKQNTRLVAARGDLYVEIGKPHEIATALKLIVEKDPEAVVGSRLFLSIIPHTIRSSDIQWLCSMVLSKNPDAIPFAQHLMSCAENPEPDVPSCADFLEVSWLYDIGYRTMMLCDELCLKEDFLGAAVSAFDGFRNDYCRNSAIPHTPKRRPLFDRIFSR